MFIGSDPSYFVVHIQELYRLRSVRLVVVSVLVSFFVSSTLGISGAIAANENFETNTVNSISTGTIYDNIATIENLSERFHYRVLTSVSSLENSVALDLETILNSSGFQSYFSKILASGSHYNLSWGMSYNYSAQTYGVYIVLTIMLKYSQREATFGYSSENSTAYGPMISLIPITHFAKNYWNSNWAGYEFYDTNNKYPLNYIVSATNVSTIILPPNPNDNVPQEMATWIGFSSSEGGGGDFAQTGYDRMIYWQSLPPGYVYGNYYLWYETNVGTIYQYPGSSNLNPDWDLAFSITVNQNSTVTYGATISNISEAYASSSQYFGSNEAYWAQFMVEAPEYSGPYTGGTIITQIAKFYPTVSFIDPYVSGPDYQGGLNTLYNNGYYWDDLMNQTTSSNQNIQNEFLVSQGWGQPEMTWENSNYVEQ